MRLVHHIRLAIALVVATLFPLTVEVIGLFGFSGSVRDSNGNIEPGHFSKYVDIMLYAQGPFTILVTLVGWAVVFSLARVFGVVYSRGIILLAALLGLIAGAMMEALLSLGAPQVVTPPKIMGMLAAGALLLALEQAGVSASATTLANLGRFDESRKQAEAVLKINPDNPKALELLRALKKAK